MLSYQVFSYLNLQAYQGIIEDSYRLLPESKKELSDRSIFFFLEQFYDVFVVHNMQHRITG
jgi:hypothetical protein